MAKVIRTFSIEELEEDYNLPYGAVYEETVDKRRWYSVMELVFKADDDKHYMVDYMDPATEMQEGQDCWDYDYVTGLVEATQVEEIPVTTTKWVPVNSSLVKE